MRSGNSEESRDQARKKDRRRGRVEREPGELSEDSQAEFKRCCRMTREQFKKRRKEMFNMGDKIEVWRPDHQVVDHLIRGGVVRFTELQVQPLFTR